MISNVGASARLYEGVYFALVKSAKDLDRLL